jgi:hypothetical protein
MSILVYRSSSISVLGPRNRRSILGLYSFISVKLEPTLHSCVAQVFGQGKFKYYINIMFTSWHLNIRFFSAQKCVSVFRTLMPKCLLIASHKFPRCKEGRGDCALRALVGTCPKPGDNFRSGIAGSLLASGFARGKNLFW